MITRALFLLFVFIQSSQAFEVVRIDKNQVETFIPYTHKYELIIADNCLHCLKQLEIMKECVNVDDVVVILDNLSKLSDEQLRRLVRKKKIIYKTYLMDSELRKVYDFKGITPAIWINTDKSKIFYTGVVSCDLLKK